MRVQSSGLATDGLLDLLTSSILHLQECSRLSGPSNQALSDLRVRFHLNAAILQFSVLGLFPDLNCPHERGQEREGMIQIVLYKIVFRITQLIQDVLESCLVNIQVFHRAVFLHAKIPPMVLDLPQVLVSFSKNRVRTDTTSSSFIFNFSMI